MSIENNENNFPKKRGRKPKGGKIIKKEEILIKDTTNNFLNTILHLKCKITDIKEKTDGLTYNSEVINVIPYEEKNSFMKMDYKKNENERSIEKNKKEISPNIKEEDIIHKKLNELSKNLHNNNIYNNSSCFWCTYSFDNPSIHIPQQYYKEHYEVYGCFCSPECAASYLFKEDIDDSVKFERYHLLNYIYGKIYNYTKNIRLAPSPFYTIEKYMGNLTIQEYRQLLKYERLCLIINKPLIKIYPELHEDNENFETFYNGKSILKPEKDVSKNNCIKNIYNIN